MAFMIPECPPPGTVGSEETLFASLARAMPPECAIWHRSALELDDTQAVPFLALGDDIGIAVITPLDWKPASFTGLVSNFWQRGKSTELPAAQQSELRAIEGRIEALRRLLVESQMSELVSPAGRLRPALHRIHILACFTTKDINQLKLRNIASDALVLALDELNQLYDILKQHTPADGRLTGESFNAVRLVISPGVEVRLRTRQKPVTVVHGSLEVQASPGSAAIPQMTLDLHQEQVIKSFAHLPPEHESAARDLDARLVRGVVGSGKSLILLHRAKFLAQLNPGWEVLVLTYNRSLSDFLQHRLNDLPGPRGKVRVVHFHAWCWRLLNEKGLWRPNELKEKSRKSFISTLAPSAALRSVDNDQDYLLEELDWIRDQGFTDWQLYERAKRRGRAQRLTGPQRRPIWDLLSRYRDTLRRQQQFDWPEVPLMVLDGIAQNKIPTQRYHAILVDEAQDFAPSWFAVIQQMLKPATNMLFLASDATQKIYRRSLSWRTLGIDVTGNRSRVLNRSYRNTYEILRVAYELVGNDASLREELRSEGDDVIRPVLDVGQMRRGPVPFILQFGNPSAEIRYIASEIKALAQQGYGWNEIGVIHRDHHLMSDVETRLRAEGIPVQLVRGRDINLEAPDVKLLTYHNSKGLEFSVVFVAGVERLQARPGLSAEELEAATAEERRLLYVGMTRARDRLYITHTGPLPVWALAAMALAENKIPRA